MAWPNDGRTWRNVRDGERPEYDIYDVGERLVLMPHKVTLSGSSGRWIAELSLKRNLIYINYYRKLAYDPTTLLMWAMAQVAEGKVENS